VPSFIQAAVITLLAFRTLLDAGEKRRQSPPAMPTLEEYVRSAQLQSDAGGPSPGSLFASQGRLAELARDLRAASVNDLVTVVVTESATALSRGATSSNRSSSAKSSIGALAGVTRAPGPLSDLTKLGGERQLQGQGETSRELQVAATLTALVTHVLPNGNLVLEGAKEVTINSERQLVILRGIARWNDLSSSNQIRSDRLAQLEVYVSGKGVVNDAIHRPNFLYRLLLGILPF